MQIHCHTANNIAQGTEMRFLPASDIHHNNIYLLYVFTVSACMPVLRDT
jgi:hypothetical protein